MSDHVSPKIDAILCEGCSIRNLSPEAARQVTGQVCAFVSEWFHGELVSSERFAASMDDDDLRKYRSFSDVIFEAVRLDGFSETDKEAFYDCAATQAREDCYRIVDNMTLLRSVDDTNPNH